MNAETIRALLRQEPFEICLTNGDRHPVRHPEQVVLGQNRLVVVYPDNDRFAICSFLHVASVGTFPPPAS